MVKKILVKNRSNSFIGYEIPDMNLKRDFAPYEEKKDITEEEIRKLSYQVGGQELIDGYLFIQDAEVAEELSPKYAGEPEYSYGEKDLIYLIKEASVEEFLDCLDFAPPGVCESLKTLCITLPATNTEKMDAIQKKFGINIANAIANYKASLEEENNAQPTGKRERRVAPTAKETSYNVVSRRAPK